MLTDPDQGDTTVVTMQGWTLTHKPGLRMHFVVSGVTRCARTKKASLAGVLRHQDRDPAPNLSQNGLWRTQGKKNTVTRPMSTGEEVLYCSTVCAASEKKKKTRPLALRVRDEHGCMGNKVDTLRHAGGLHPPRRGCRCAEVEQGYNAMEGRRSEAQVNLKRDSSSWKDAMRKRRHEDADECSQPTLDWVGLELGR